MFRHELPGYHAFWNIKPIMIFLIWPIGRHINYAIMSYHILAQNIISFSRSEKIKQKEARRITHTQTQNDHLHLIISSIQ